MSPAFQGVILPHRLEDFWFVSSSSTRGFTSEYSRCYPRETILQGLSSRLEGKWLPIDLLFEDAESEVGLEVEK